MLIRAGAAAGPAPVVIAIHGYKGTPAGLEYYSQLTEMAAATGTFVAYPAGSPLDLGFGWNSGAGRFATSGVDDVAVVEQVLQHALARPCADVGRVYLVGESNGGGMVLRAACDPRLAHVTGVVLVNAAVDEGVLANCAAAAVRVGDPVSVFAVAGRADRVIPYDGSRDPFLATEAWFIRVAQSLAGCGPDAPGRAPWSDHVEVITSAGCGAQCAVLFAIDDGPHTWPGSFEGANGLTPGSFELTELLGQVLTGQRQPCGS